MTAYDVRCQWLRMMGFSDEEIQENCRQSPPTNILEEFEQYDAMIRMIKQYGDVFAPPHKNLYEKVEQ